MNTVTISGRVINAAGQPAPNVRLRFVSDLNTLGAVQGAVAALGARFRWTRLVTGFSGHRWNAYTKFVANEIAGIDFGEFKDWVVEHNPSLVETQFIFQAERSYLFPNQTPTESAIVWDKSLSGFVGNRWQCWQQYITGKVPSLTWSSFKEQVAEHNPHLAQDEWLFVAHKSYQLPRLADQSDYELLVETNQAGEYRVDHLPVGVYRVKVHVPGLLPQVRDLSAQQDGTLDVKLAAPIITVAAERHDFVAVRPGSISFWLNGQKMQRFIGLNMTLLPHYGKTYRESNGEERKVLPKSQTDHRDKYLDRARQMNAKVVRCFIPHRGVPFGEIATRLDEILEMADKRDLYILPALIDVYHDRNAYPDPIQKDDQAVYRQQGEKSRLTPEFFQSKHETLFMPFVKFIVERFRPHPRIFAWEIGNELKWDHQPDEFVDFMLKIAQQIKTLDASHLVTTGMKSTQHAFMFEKFHLQQRLYGSDLIDFVTVHSYVDKEGTKEEEHKGIEDDARLARMLGKPLLVEEAGVVTTTPNPEEAFRDHVTHWFDKRQENDDRHQSYGYMQWGFDPETIGDGDKKLWNEYVDLYRKKATELTAI